MKGLWYVLAGIALLVGLLAFFRSLERLLTGDGLLMTQLGIGVICLFLAWLWVKRARSL
jgi:hypothetical protein